MQPDKIYITVVGRRWRDKTYGNTYHTAEIFVNGEFAYKTDEAYGYGNAYIDSAKGWLWNSGLIPPKSPSQLDYEYFEQHPHIVTSYTVVDVGLRKHL